jgi:hypothetical protein
MREDVERLHEVAIFVRYHIGAAQMIGCTYRVFAVPRG